MNARTDLADEDGGRRLEENVGDEEDQVGNVVSEIDEYEINTHSSNVGSTHVGSVHERDTVHGTNSDDQSSIDSSNNLLLLIGGESMIMIDFGAELAGGFVDVFEIGLSLDVGGIYGLVFLHGGYCVLLFGGGWMI